MGGNSDSTIKITLMIDDEIFTTYSSRSGAKVQEPDVSDKNGYLFDGWYKSSDRTDKWNFKSDVAKDDLVLYGYWIPNSSINYSVKFYDGTQLLKTIDEVHRGDNISDISFTPTDKAGYSFSGWFSGDILYDFSQPLYADVVLNAKWEANKYSIKFIADGEIISESFYTIENKDVSVPSIPQKADYTGKWEKFDLTHTLDDIEIKAIYTPIVYTATFVANNKIFTEIKYTVEDKVVLPDVPEKFGYTASWSGLPITSGDVTITAQYTPIVYTLTFMANEQVIDRINYTIEDKEVITPAIPEIEGYSAKWKDFELTSGDITVNAIYNIINYSATFVADDVIVAVLYFNIENKRVTEPEVPPKDGYTADWEQYKLSLDDIVIKAIYTPINSEAN